MVILIRGSEKSSEFSGLFPDTMLTASVLLTMRRSLAAVCVARLSVGQTITDDEFVLGDSIHRWSRAIRAASVYADPFWHVTSISPPSRIVGTICTCAGDARVYPRSFRRDSRLVWIPKSIKDKTVICEDGFFE